MTMILMYSILGVITTLASAAATSIIIAQLRRHWELHISSVRWLYFTFFVYLCAWATLRCIFFTWMLIIRDARQVDHHIEKVLTTTQQLDCFGVHSIPISTLAHNGALTAVVIAGDNALFAVTLWMFALTYELSMIATKSMDRGAVLEANRIRLYKWGIQFLIVAYGSVPAVMAIIDGGYSIRAHKWLLVNFAVQVIGLTYMICTLVFLKIRGRKYEATHGAFLPSPVYLRLKRIMVVYLVFATQFQVASMVLCTTGKRRPYILLFIGVTMEIHNCIGLALSIVTGCSQTCVFQTCSACIPEDLEAQFMQRKFGLSARTDVVRPPQQNPVFVYTDIEASSALWALAPSGIMDKATNLHDDIVRSSLLRHNGYEITTCGDSFQLAFPTIKDAVSFCLDVQLQLLVAPWPRELHGLVPATKKQRSGHRLIFSGLRVRMGIHDCADEDGSLVCARHAITGNMTYTGASKAFAAEVGELGHGGQILVTQRVAAWVLNHLEELDVDVTVEYLGRCHMPILECDYGVSQLTPSILQARRKHWPRVSARLESPTEAVGGSELTVHTVGHTSPPATRPTRFDTPSLRATDSLSTLSLSTVLASPHSTAGGSFYARLPSATCG